MSEAPPVLLNMGADVASAMGVNPMPGQLPATRNQGNEFAGVLQSALNPPAPQENANPLLGKQLEANPLLLVQAGGLANSLLPQTDLQLDAALTGKALPAEEPEFAWQTLLAEGESQDPLIPSLEMTASDTLAYPLEELAVENIIPINPAHDIDKPDSEALSDIHSPQVSAQLLPTNQPADHDNNTASALATSMAAVHGQDAAAVANPAISSAEDDVLSKMTRSQTAISKPANPVPLDTRVVETELQAEGNQLFLDKIQQLAGQGKQDGLETASNMFESIIADATDNGTVTKPVSLTGISTYAAISGTPSSLSPVAATSPTIAQLTIPPQNPDWGDTVGNKVQWMAAQNIQEARIRLHPQELGMLEVHIQVGKDQQTSISFSSPHVQVRDALESAIPRLREMFSETGLSLGDVNVSHHSSSQQGHADSNNKPANPSQASHFHSSHESTDVMPLQSILTQGDGMLDLYA